MKRDNKMYRGKVLNISPDPQFEANFSDWIYGALFYDEMEDEFDIMIQDVEGNPKSYLPKEDTICKNTQIEDKDGNMVFEKDILLFDLEIGGPKYYIIANDDGLLVAVPLPSFLDEIWQSNSPSVYRSACRAIIENSKVIDNIIDSPEWIERI